jgi:hypothetical protein
MTAGRPARSLVAAALAVSTGCATVITSSTVGVTIGSRPGAKVYVDGALAGTEPLELELANHRPHVIVVGDPAHPLARCSLEPALGVGWVVIDLVLMLWPVLVDAVTGDWKTLDLGDCTL